VARAAAEACAWLEAGARGIALLAPAGDARRGAVEAIAARAPRPFALARIAAREGHAAGSVLVRADAAVRRFGGAPTVLVVEQAELLAPDEARALRAIADHAPGDVRLVALLAPRHDTPALLRAFGGGVEWVPCAPAPTPARSGLAWPVPPRLPEPRALARGATLLLAVVSLGAALGVLLPRFAAAPRRGPVPAAAADVAAPPPASRPAAPRAGKRVARPPDPRAAAGSAAAQRPSAPADARSAGTAAPARTPAKPAAAAASAPAPAAASAPAAPAAARAAPAPRAPARPAGGYLFVNAMPRARIRVDGVAVGETPLVRVPLARGRHDVVAEFPDGRREERSIEASGAETYVVFGGTPP